MHLRIEQNSGVPLGPQIVRQIKLAIANGRVAPGERLPSARDLAAELRVNFHTVRKAYGELEREGLLHSARGRGTFVAESLPGFERGTIRRAVREHLSRLVEDLAGSELSDAELRTLVLSVFDELRARGDASAAHKKQQNEEPQE